eukprot:gene37910-46055_t
MYASSILVVLSVVALSRADSNFPSFDSIFTSKPSRLGSLSSSLQAFQPAFLRALGSATSVTEYSSGWVYYDFFSTFDCSGDVVYSSGIPINACIPGDVYARPDDDQADAYKPYQSFQVVNVTSDCAFTAIFYTDSNCTQVYDTKAPALSFPYCSVVDEMQVSPLLAYQGKCSGSMEKPLTTSSYVYSSFGFDEQCGDIGGQASQYKAYTLNLCYGIDETASTQYSYPPCTATSCPSYVAMTNFYNSSACQSSLLDTTVNITLQCSNNSASPLNLTSSERTEVFLTSLTDDQGGDDDAVLSDGAIAGVAVASVVTAGIVAAGVYVYGGSAAAAMMGSSGSAVGGVAGAEMSGNVAGGTTSAMHATAI